MSVRKLLGAIAKADLDYKLIEHNDRIAVGVSGGKDSMLLLYCLHLYKNIALKYHHKHFDVVGIHLEMGFPDMNFEKISEFCKQNNIEYHDIPTNIYDILKINQNDDGTLKCSLCSKFKKGAVINEAKRLNCQKTAFAHHGDDAVETLLLNAIYGGRIATFTPKMYLDESGMTFIRPFVYADEKMIINTVKNLNLPTVKSTCPMDGYTKRQDIKEMLNRLYDEYPMAKSNFLNMLHNQKQLKLWEKE